MTAAGGTAAKFPAPDFPSTFSFAQFGSANQKNSFLLTTIKSLVAAVEPMTELDAGPVAAALLCSAVPLNGSEYSQRKKHLWPITPPKPNDLIFVSSPKNHQVKV